MDAQTREIIVQFFTLLGIVVLAFRDVIRTRREHAAMHDTAHLERIRSEDAERKRQYDIVAQSMLQTTQLIKSLEGVAQQLEKQHIDRDKDREVEVRRIDMREQVANAQNQSLIENTQAVGEVASNLNRVKTEVSTLGQAVGTQNLLLRDGFGQVGTVVSSKIDTALVKAGDMLENKIDPVQAALNELRDTLKDVQEKVSHIPELEECLTDMNQAVHDLDGRMKRLTSERDSAVNEVASQQQTITALRNALVVSDRDKLSKETELARLKEVLVPPSTAASPSEVVPLPDRAEGAQPNVPGGVA